MDSIEVSRQTAERLHAAAVVAGKDPRDPYAFACAEAVRRQISVEKLPLGDVRLHGAQALYDPDALLILHSDAGDAFTQAFLVAHEIGHVELVGATEPSSADHFDPLRSAEESPVGVDRVTDYSRRERREVQMDLFAREFLLPRGWLKWLHLQEDASAKAISEMCNAPHAVVVQQLLDALLLPAREHVSIKENRNRELHPDQVTAIQHRGKAYLLEAGPGTGKTETLVRRVENILTSGVDPQCVLLLTFSNKAAGELSERIAIRSPEAAAAMWIGTFHAFGFDLLRRFHDYLGLPADPKFIDRSEAIDMLESEYPRLNLTYFRNLWDPSRPLGEILNAISRANDEVVDAAAYQELAKKMRLKAIGEEQTEAACRCLEIAQVFALYERLKKNRGGVDFGDLVAMPVRLCEQFTAVREHLRNQYVHVLVDEFQDVNRSSIRLLKALTGDGENLWAVGDAKQSIYRFRGASSYNTTRFGHDDFAGGVRGRLTVNYRSVEEIRDTFIQFGTGMRVTKGSDVALDAARGSAGHRPECRSVGTDEEEIGAVAEGIEEMRSAGYAYRDQAILCSGNDRLARFGAALEGLNIPVLYLGNLFERPEVKDLLCILSLVIDRRAMGLLRVAAFPEYSISLADIASVLAYLKANDHAPLQWGTILDLIPGLSADGRQGLHRVATLIEGFRPDAKPWELLATIILDRSRIAAGLAKSTDVRGRARGIAVWQLLNFLRSQPAGKGLPIARILERIRKLVLYADEGELRKLPAAAQGLDAVRLMTMHGSKGLEFPVVHIPGLTAASLPGNSTRSLARNTIPPDGMIEGANGSAAELLEESIAEERECLFFVALSRARDRLLIYHPTITATRRSRPRSPFIGSLGETIRVRKVQPKRLPLPPSDEIPVTITIQKPFAFSDHQLSLYDRCPRRFLYTHVLQIGGRRIESAFMKLHAAVQQVIDLFVKSPEQTQTAEAVDEALSAAWYLHGPIDHGYSEEYRGIARQLLRFFMESSSNLKSLPLPQLRMAVSGGEIVVTPDQTLVDAEGKIHVRRIKTGHQGSEDLDDLAAAAFHLTASARSPGCRVQFVHLSDETVTTIAMTARVLGNRTVSISQSVEAITAGHFRAKPTIACPNCPAYFVCGDLPAGELRKNPSE